MNATAADSVRAIQPDERRLESLHGALIGTAVGDSLGLPMEGLSARRIRRMFPGPLRQQLIGPFGMISDDTEHTVMGGQALIENPVDVMAFQRCLAAKFRWWLASVPAGVGFATLRSVIRLWLGFAPSRSGVNSAGNGPAMRSALLGVFFRHDRERRLSFVQASTEITHRDPRALIGACAVAECAAWMTEGTDDVAALIAGLLALGEDPEWQRLVVQLQQAFEGNLTVEAFAAEVGAKEGVSGYVFQTVPVAIYAAVRHRVDFEAALMAVIACGGDTDTVGAITGALVGARVGAAGIPRLWRERVVDWPRSMRVFEEVAVRLCEVSATLKPGEPIRYFWPALPFRNLTFLFVVLAHGFRRLLPPY